MKPLWKQLFDTVEQSAAPALERMTASDGFAEVMRTGLRISRDLNAQSEELSRRWLHLFNLPAAGDIAKLRNQIGSLEAEVRSLRRQLDEAANPVEPRAAKKPAAKRTTKSNRSKKLASVS